MTSWTDYVAYRCNSCREGCLNERTSARARFQECADCVSVPSLERADPVPDPEPPTPSGPPNESTRCKRDRGARTPVSERERSERENTALLGAPRDSSSSGLDDWPRAPLLRSDGGENDVTR